MADDRLVRKLTAVLYADVAGYSRLTGIDEEGTHQRVMTALDRATHLIQLRGGSVLRYAGDAVLAEFSSALGAVRTAHEIQEVLAERESGLPDSHQIALRIGINLGDVLADRGEVYGDGVNLAARLEEAAPPGGLCISGTVHEQVEGKLEIQFEDGGERRFKNIARPVRIYLWNAGGRVSRTVPDSPDAPPHVQRPSIAVLPFDNLSGDPSVAHIGDGVVEEILTSLASISGLHVAARHSSFAYRGRSQSVSDIGRELKVRYILEGSVRSAGNRVRISTQLVDVESGNYLWSERYDRELDDIFEFQDHVSREVTVALQTTLDFGEALVRLQRGTHNHHAWKLCVQGVHLYSRTTRADNAEARRVLEEALAHDHEYDGARALLGWVHYAGVRHALVDDPARSVTQLKIIIEQLFARDPNHGDGHFLTCAYKLLSRDYQAAIAAGERAIAALPADANVHAYLAQVYSYAGRPQDALPRLRHALRLAPYYPAWMAYPLIDVHQQLGQLKEAIDYARAAVVRSPNALALHARLAGVLGADGRAEEGRAALARVYELDTEFSISRFVQHLYYADLTEARRMCDGLRALGATE